PRMADRQAPVAVLQDTGLAHVDVRELGFVRDLHEPAVDAAVAAEGLAFELAAIGQDDRGIAARRAGDMARREHVALFVDDHAAALGLADAEPGRPPLHVSTARLHGPWNGAQASGSPRHLRT